MQYLRRKQIVAWIKLEIDRGKTEAQAKESLRILAGEDKQLSGIADLCKEQLKERGVDLHSVV